MVEGGFTMTSEVSGFEEGERREPGRMQAIYGRSDGRSFYLSGPLKIRGCSMSQAVGRFRESKARGLEPTYPDAQFAVRPAMFRFCSMGRAWLK